MSRLRSLLLALALPVVTLPAASMAQSTPAAPVAVVGFAGPDTDLGIDLAGSLATALGQYDDFSPIDGDAVQEALSDLKLPPKGSLTPPQIQRLGKQLGARFILTGAYAEQDDQLNLKAAIYDAQTGDPVEGGPVSVAGARSYRTALTQRLAHRLRTRGKPDTFSGLILDARHLTVTRSMGPRLLDEDGNVLYPVSPKHVPPMEILQEQGMAAYTSDEAIVPRSGPRPLIARALSVAGTPQGADLVVSREIAAQIRQANESAGFLESWAFTILIRPANMGKPSLFRFKNGDVLTGCTLNVKEGVYTVLTDLGQLRFPEQLIVKIEEKIEQVAEQP